MSTMEEEEDWGHDDGTQLEEGADEGSASDGNKTIADDEDEVTDDVSATDTQLVPEDTLCEIEHASPSSNNVNARARGGVDIARDTGPISFAACTGTDRGAVASERRFPVPRPTEIARGGATGQEQATEDTAQEQTQGDSRDDGIVAGSPAAHEATASHEIQRKRRRTPEEGGAGLEGAQADPRTGADGENGDGCEDDHDNDDGGLTRNRGLLPGQVKAGDLTAAVEGEMHPTLETSPCLRSPPADDAASASHRDNHSPQGRESQYTELLSLRLSPVPGDSSTPQRREQGASPELTPTTPAAGRRVGDDMDSESSGGLSPLRVAPPSLPRMSPRSDEVAERRPPSPPRRTGQGSGLFLRRGGPRGTAAASAGGCFTPKGGASPLSPSNSDPSHGKTEQTQSEELVASPPAASAMSSTMSTVVSPLEPSAAAAIGVAAGTPRSSEIVRRTGRLAADTSAAAGEGESVGFLSSAEPPAKTAGAGTVASDLSSSQPLPRGWLDEQLAAAAAHTSPQLSRARRARAEDEEGTRERNMDTRRSPSDEGAAVVAKKKNAAAHTATTNPIVAPATKAFKKPSPTKAVPGPGGWIQTKVSRSTNGVASAATAGRGGGCSRTVADSQEGLFSQNILAVGVPRDRCVPVPRPPPARVAAAADDDDENRDLREDGLSQFREEVDEEGGTPAGMALSLNTQDINPTDFSQIQKDCSQDRKEVERLLDEAIAEGQCLEGAGNADAAGSLSSSPPPNSVPVGAERDGANAGPGMRGGSSRAGLASRDADGGDGGGDGGGIEAAWRGRNTPPAASKRKSMKASVAAVAGGEDAIGGAEDRRGRGAVSRTPGMHMGGSGSKSSAKKKKVPVIW